MNVSTESNYDISGLNLQDVENRSSFVNRINFEIGAIGWEDECHNTPYIDRELESEQFFFETLYGFRKDQAGTLKRMTPSAGAIYPLELLLLKFLNGQWRLLHYNYKAHHFYEVHEGNMTALTAKFAAVQGRSYLLFYAIFWRSAQKYGVRAFRYAYLDASFIFHNVLLITSSWKKKPAIHLHYPCALSDEFLPGCYDKKLLLALELSEMPAHCDISKDAHVLDASGKGSRHSSISYPGIYNANLLRVNKLYTCVSQNNNVQFPQPVEWTENNTVEDLMYYLYNRSSAKSFISQAIPAAVYQAIQQDMSRLAMQLDFLSAGLDFDIVFLPANVDMYTPCIEYMRRGAHKALTDKENLQQQIAAACQQQAIMLNSAFIMVVTVNINEHFRGSTGYLDYARAILLSGMFCAKAYQSSLQRGIGTTTIGGFSEKMMKQLIQLDDHLAIVVQAFGIADDSRVKHDGAKLISLD